MIDSLIYEARQTHPEFVRRLLNHREAYDTVSELSEISLFIDTVGYLVNGFTVRQNHERALALHFAVGDTLGAIEQLLSTPRSSGGHLFSNTAKLDMYREALNLAEQFNDSATQLTVMDTMLHLYSWANVVNRRDSSLLYSKKCHDYAVALGDRRREARYILGLANFKDPYEERDTVIADYLRSATIREDVGDTSGVAYMYHGLGRIWSENGELDSALHYYNRSLECFRSIDDTRSVATTQMTLGFLYHQQERFADAESAFRESIDINPRGGMQRYWVALGLQSLGSFDKAIAYLKEAVDSSDETYQFKFYYSSMAECYSHLGRTDDVMTALQQAQQHMSGADSAYEVGLYITPTLASHHSRRGLVDSAIGLLEPILKREHDSGTAYGQAVAWAKIGGVYHENERYEEAINAFTKARALGEDSKGRVTDLDYVSRTLAYCYMETGDLAKARDILQGALTDAESYHRFRERQYILRVTEELEKMERGDTTETVD